MNQQIFKINKITIICFLLFATPLCVQAASNNRENAVVRAVRYVSPAVVNISSEYEVRAHANPFSGLGMDSLFDSFFKDFFDHRLERRLKRSSLGSGVIIDGQRGLILTNEHVIVKTGTITVILKDEREFEAQIVGADPDSDLAVLKIVSKEPLPAIDMGDSDDIMIGETIIAIGNPFGFSHTVTTGVVSAVSRSIRTDDRIFQDFIQTDASINPGNSGGPLLNISGELIGINTAIYAKAQGIGFAIPINKAKRVISDLIRFGEVIQPWIGITVQDLNPRIASYMELPGEKGVLVKEVESASPAERSGIVAGDVLLSVGNKPILSGQDYHATVRNYAAGDTINLNLWRNASEAPVSVKTTVYPIERAMDLAYKLMGIRVEDLSTKTRFHKQIIAKEGVIISEINRHAYLFRIGADLGDVIRKIDEIPVKNIFDFKKAVIKYRNKASVVILLQRGEHGYYISVKLS